MIFPTSALWGGWALVFVNYGGDPPVAVTMESGALPCGVAHLQALCARDAELWLECSKRNFILRQLEPGQVPTLRRE